MHSWLRALGRTNSVPTFLTSRKERRNNADDEAVIYALLDTGPLTLIGLCDETSLPSWRVEAALKRRAGNIMKSTHRNGPDDPHYDIHPGAWISRTWRN